jgi:hypothetical protein
MVFRLHRNRPCEIDSEDMRLWGSVTIACMDLFHRKRMLLAIDLGFARLLSLRSEVFKSSTAEFNTKSEIFYSAF